MTGSGVNPDELLNKGGSLKEPSDLPKSPMDQKKRMGVNGGKTPEGGAGMKKVSGGIPKGGMSSPVDQATEKVGEKAAGIINRNDNRGDTHKKADAAAGKMAGTAVKAVPVVGEIPGVSGAVEGFVKKGGVEGVVKIQLKVALVIITIPLVVIFSIVAYLLSDPWGAASHVITDKAVRTFVANAADGFVAHQGPVHWAVWGMKKLHIADRPGGGVAVAAPDNKPDSSSFEYKISQIDWKKSQYQTLGTNSCPYDFKFVQVVNYDNKTISVPKPLENDSNDTPTVVNKQTGKTLSADEYYDNTDVGYCLSRKYPIFNMLSRQPITRDVNNKVNLHLKYAAPKKSKQLTGNYADDKKYVYDKTLSRITSTSGSSIKFTDLQKRLLNKIDEQYRFESDLYNKRPGNSSNPGFIPIPVDDKKSDIPVQIQKMYTDMSTGTSPYDLDINDYFNVPTIDDPSYNNAGSVLAGLNIAEVMCPFVYGFMDIDNSQQGNNSASARAAIESRLSGAERDAVKFLTVSDTRRADDLNNNESNLTIQQLDNWANSTAYQLDVNNSQVGIEMNPEGIHNRAYDANQSIVTDSGGAMRRVQEACHDIANRANLSAAQGQQADKDMVDAYKQLKGEIVNQSSGIFNSSSDFGLEQILTGYVRTGSITSVSGLESGPDNFNRIAMGYRQLMNDYNQAMGGRFLTADEANAIAVRDENIDRKQQKEGGIAYRLFNTNNIHSVASIFQQNTLTKKTTLTAVIGVFKSLLDPLRSLADINYNLTFYLTGQNNKAFAASNTVNSYFKVDNVGFTQDELSIDAKQNSDIIEDLKKNGPPAIKTKLAHYDECLKMKIPSSAYFQIAEDRYTPGQIDFVYFPEKHKGGDNDPTASAEFAKFSECKFLLLDATDMSKPDQLLAIRFRMYKYFNTQLDLLIALSSNDDNPSIYENPGALKK